jgi:hypothetical protein
VAFYTLVPFLMITIGAWNTLRARWPVCPALLAAGGNALIAAAVSGAELAWSDGFDYCAAEHRAHLFPAFFAAWPRGAHCWRCATRNILRPLPLRVRICRGPYQ